MAVTLLVALPRGDRRRVFRPARRVSWPTRIFAFLVLVLALGTVAASLLVVLPARVAGLSQSESHELAQARLGAVTVSQSLGVLWGDLGAHGGFGLTPDQVTQELASAQRIEKQAADALNHADAAKAYLVEAEAIPFQVHTPAFVLADQPAVVHVEASLQLASRLAHGATLQLLVAQHGLADAARVETELTPRVQSRDWAGAARTAADLQGDLKAQAEAAGNLEAFIDPLWGRWLDALSSYAYTSQQFSLAEADHQERTAQDLARSLASTRDAMGATHAAALANGPAWQQKTIAPLLAALARELSAAGA